MRIHTTKDGAQIKLSDMTDSHLTATIQLMERSASRGITVREGGGSDTDDFWYDEYTLYEKEALDHMGYDDYVRERDWRERKQDYRSVREKEMIVIIETTDFRGDHDADVEIAVDVREDLPISELRMLAKRYGKNDRPATLRIIPCGKHPEEK